MIVIIRHGRTRSNAQGLFLGRADPPLDEVGEAQAVALGRALGPVDEVVSSPLLRARQTAEAISGQIVVDDRFIELDYGEWDEKPLSIVNPDTWEHWRSNLEFAPPGGESFAALGERVSSALDELLPKARERTIVIVTHLAPLKAAVAWALGVSDAISWRLIASTASITRIDASRGHPALVVFNDTAHLEPAITHPVRLDVGRARP